MLEILTAASVVNKMLHIEISRLIVDTGGTAFQEVYLAKAGGYDRDQYPDLFRPGAAGRRGAWGRIHLDRWGGVLGGPWKIMFCYQAGLFRDRIQKAQPVFE